MVKKRHPIRLPPSWVSVQSPERQAWTSTTLHATNCEPEVIRYTQVNRIAWLSDETTLKRLYEGLKKAGAIDAEWSAFREQFELSGEPDRPDAAYRYSWVRWLWTQDDLSFLFSCLASNGLISDETLKAWAATAADCFEQKTGGPFDTTVLRQVSFQERKAKHLQVIRSIVKECLRK